jgi:hypothetical protein
VPAPLHTTGRTRQAGNVTWNRSSPSSGDEQTAAGDEWPRLPKDRALDDTHHRTNTFRHMQGRSFCRRLALCAKPHVATCVTSSASLLWNSQFGANHQHPRAAMLLWRETPRSWIHPAKTIAPLAGICSQSPSSSALIFLSFFPNLNQNELNRAQVRSTMSFDN